MKKLISDARALSVLVATASNYQDFLYTKKELLVEIERRWKECKTDLQRLLLYRDVISGLLNLTTYDILFGHFLDRMSCTIKSAVYWTWGISLSLISVAAGLFVYSIIRS